MGLLQGGVLVTSPATYVDMIKKTKTTFICEYCNRVFYNPTTCLSHEDKCKILTEDTNRLISYIDTLIRCYHKKGYTIDLRYSDRYDNDLIVDLKRK